MITTPGDLGPLTADPGDVGHLLPADVWDTVVAGALERLELLANGQPSRGFGAIDRTIPARSHGGAMVPRLGVIHSAETPLAAGYAYSIAANWFATKAETSATVMIDPAETIRLLPDDVVSYAVGPRANGFTLNVEQAGYARLSRAEWLTVAGRQQMRRVAEYMVDSWKRWGIPLRWATDAQIRAAAAGGAPQGWTVHDGIRRVLGGTTHTDPMPYYPTDELMALAVSLANPNTLEDVMPQFDLIRNSDTGSMVMAAPGGVWVPIPSPPYLTLYVARGRCPAVALNVPTNEFDHFRDYVYANGAPARAQGVRHTASGELQLTEQEVLALLKDMGQPVLTVDQIIGAAPVLA